MNQPEDVTQMTMNADGKAIAAHYARQFERPLAERFPFVQAIFAPVHALGFPGELTAPTHAVRITNACTLRAPTALAEPARDLSAFLTATFGLQLPQVADGAGPTITLTLGAETPSQGYRITCTENEIVVAGSDAAGVMYGVHELEFQLARYSEAALPPGSITRAPALTTRIYRSPVAPYYVDETITGEDYYPDTYLDRLAHHGFNGIFIHQTLRELAPSPIFTTYGTDATRRLATLRQLIARAARYHIRVYLYLTEPLAMAPEDPAWRGHEELRGAHSLLDGTFALCTSQPAVREHLRESVAAMSRALPGLGGIVQISASEHHHHCWSHVDPLNMLTEATKPPSCACPRCAERSPQEIVQEVITLVHDGLKVGNPTAEHIAWNWSWCMYEQDPQAGIVTALPDGVRVMGDFERGQLTEIAGLPIINEEYSLSIVGPSPRFQQLANVCALDQRPLWGRVQLPVTHQSSTLPHWPVMFKVAEKCQALVESGASGVMACWNFGNFLGISTELCRLLWWTPAPAAAEAVAAVAERHFGALAPEVLAAWAHFSRAAEQFPQFNDFLYYGPLSRGPAMPFFPYATGRPMAPSWFSAALGDRISDYTARVPAANIVNALRAMDADWQHGLEQLCNARAKVAPEAHEALRKEYAVAALFSCLARSAANFTEYIALRDNAGTDVPERRRSILLDELSCARQAAVLAEEDPRFGFHGEAYDYLFTPQLIREKIAVLEAMLEG